MVNIWFTILLSAAMAGVLGLLGREVMLFVRKHDGYTQRRLTLRLATAGMLLFLFGSILAGVRLFGLHEPFGQAREFVIFWSCVTLLTAAVFCLVIADFRLIADDSRRQENAHWREIAEVIADHAKTRKEKDG